MGFLTMPQLVLSAAIGGSAPADVLCANAEASLRPKVPKAASKCRSRSGGRAVNRLLNG